MISLFKSVFYKIRLFFSCNNLFDLKYGKGLVIGSGCRLGPCKYITIGENVFLNNNCSITSSRCEGSNIYIGNNVMMGEGVKIIGGNHSFSRTDIPMILQGEGEQQDIVISDDVWIGANVIILSGVEIGRGTVIGAGSVVTKSIPSFNIYAGNPAKKIGKRV